MTQITDKIIQGINLGKPQTYKKMSLFPIFLREPGKLIYLSLKQALNQHLIVITEVSQGGSVPNLKVVNQGELPVLLLDGEEISGAKQNRILNTTILLLEKSETIIPVSCTERGRWSYDKPYFEESGNMMSAQMRSSKLESVSSSLKSSESFRSDQGKVWADIDEMSHKMGVNSQTSALQDVYASTDAQLGEHMRAFPLQEGQAGIAVCFGDKVIGLDCVSRPEVWADLHSKLVKSYALEHIMTGKTEGECKPDSVQNFVSRISTAHSDSFKSVGYGEDIRLESPELIGSCLWWQETAIHLEAYARQQGSHETNYHSPRSRFQR
jgi:hypothetical protein